MQSRGEVATMRRWAKMIVTLLAVTVVLVSTTQAADEVATRVVYWNQKVEMTEVGDVPGHFVGFFEQPGMIFITKGPFSGEIGTRKGTTYIDTVKGKGTITSYLVYTFKDGSTMSLKAATSSVIPLEGGGITFEGTYEMTGGTKRFEGMNGKGTFKGERIGPSQPGWSYVDSTGTQWK